MNDQAEKPAVALSIAGFDPSGGAGITADARAMAVAGAYPVSVITAITRQNTFVTAEVEAASQVTIAGQLDTLLHDVHPRATKTGLLPSVDSVETVAERTRLLGKLVIDPVSRSSSGTELAGRDAMEALKSMLIPVCDLATPNYEEAELLSGITIENDEDLRRAAEAILNLGAAAVCITGGHRHGKPVDILYDGTRFHEIGADAERIDFEIHGTGCFFSAATAACLSLDKDLVSAVKTAKKLTVAAISNAVRPGSGMAVPWPPTT